MKYVPWVLLLVVAVLYGKGCADAGKLAAEVRAHERTIDSLFANAERVDTQYVTDTATFTKWRDRWHTVVDSQYITDTVWVKQALVTADSTIHACSVALETCEHRVAVRDSIISQQDSLVTLLKKQKPSRFGCVVGATGSDKGVRPGVACGFRVTR